MSSLRGLSTAGLGGLFSGSFDVLFSGSAVAFKMDGASHASATCCCGGHGLKFLRVPVLDFFESLGHSPVLFSG